MGPGLGGASPASAVTARPGPRYLDLTHETLAVGMATGYWLVTRRLAAVLLHAGPGLLQGANAIHGALLTGAPMLVASSESVTYGEGDGPDPGSQWYRNLSFVGGPHAFAAPFVKWSSHVPRRARSLYGCLVRAAELAQRAAGRAGVPEHRRSRRCWRRGSPPEVAPAVARQRGATVAHPEDSRRLRPCSPRRASR